jgi:hypothetical protein
MRTAMQILIESLESRRYREKDDSRCVIYNIAILLAEDLLELEREQIINAHGIRYSDITEETVKGEEYYNKTYNQDSELPKEDKTFKQKSKWTKL